MLAEHNENWMENGIEFLRDSRGVIRPIKGRITLVTDFIELSSAIYASYMEATIPVVSTYGAGSAVLATRLILASRLSLSNRKLAR